MLPSSGYFKHLPCPFFASGLCERPHCHFRHLKKAEARPVAGPEEEPSQLLQYVNDALRRVEQDMVKVSSLGYVPTPMVACPKAPKARGRPERYIPAQSVPQYRPTPLAELRKRRPPMPVPRERVPPPKSLPTPAAKPAKPPEVSDEGESQTNGSVDDEEVEMVQEEVDAIVSLRRPGGLDAASAKPDRDPARPEGASARPEGASTKPEGASAKPEGASTKPEGASTKPEGASAKPEGVPAKPADTKPDGVSSESDSRGTTKDASSVKEAAGDVVPQETNGELPGSASDKSHSAAGHSSSSKHSSSRLSSSKSHSSSRHSSSRHSSSKHSSSKRSPSRHSSSKHSSSKHSSSSSKHSSSKGRSSKEPPSKEPLAEESLSEEPCSKGASSKDSASEDASKETSRSKDPSKHSSSKHHSSKHSSSKHSSSKSSKHSSSSSSKHSTSKHSSSSASKHSSKGVSAEPSKNGKGAPSSSSTSSRHSSSKQPSSRKHTSSSRKQEAKVEKSDSEPEAKKARKAQEEEASSTGSQSERAAARDSEPEAVVSTPFELEWEMDSDEDEEETLEECRRIFNEAHSTSPVAGPTKEERPLVKSKRPTALEPAVPSKKRVAHNPELVKRPERPMGLAAHVSAAQAMHNRFAQLQQRYANQGCSAQRVAPVANAPLLAAARRSALAQLPLSQATPAGAHVVASQPKGQPRVAHVPALVLSKRPTIPAEYGSRVPTAVRQRYLNLFLDECAKGCSTEDEAIQKALAEEKQTYERSSGKSIYLNVAVNTLKRLRREAAEGLPSSSPPPQPATTSVAVHTPAGNRVVSHEVLLQGARAARTSFSIEKNRYRKPAQELTAARFYELLEQYRLSTEQLVEYNYPRPHPTEPGRALFGGTDSSRQYSKPNERTGLRCSRCGATFSLTEEGEYKREEECVHHWGRLWKKRIAGALESRYSCCQGDGESDGCCVGKGHVHEGPEPKELTGFVSTLEKSPPPGGGGPGVFALDCEMCYTTEGVELTRVTVVGWDRQPVYESLVKPRGRILDYNTRFSGLTEEDLAGVRTSLREVQASLLSLFSARTLLVGHSLDSDLRALRLVHGHVVDTAAVFPHRRGLPYKRALRTLMAEFLNKIIQDGVDGHDSQEDAAACMELMLWRVREDLKKGVR